MVSPLTQGTTISNSTNSNHHFHPKIRGYESEASTMGGPPSETCKGSFDLSPIERIPSQTKESNANIFPDPENVIEADSTFHPLILLYLITPSVFSIKEEDYQLYTYI